VNIPQFVNRRYVGSLLAFVAGASLSLSFAPFEWWPVAILAPAVLIGLVLLVATTRSDRLVSITSRNGDS